MADVSLLCTFCTFSIFICPLKFVVNLCLLLEIVPYPANPFDIHM